MEDGDPTPVQEVERRQEIGECQGLHLDIESHVRGAGLPERPGQAWRREG